jgi:methylated-DNA-[protein]-cysteine S-methyltransferase
MARSSLKTASPPLDILVAFPTRLGWMALVGSGDTLKQLTFGHSTADAAIADIDPALRRGTRRGTWNRPLIARLKAYAAGRPDNFADVPVDLGPLSPFRQRVIAGCRHIGPGQTRTYGELAAGAGSPGAARAVGQCMATNRIPLVVPCHRVVPANGKLGGYSGGQGTATKRRLLEMESFAGR